MEESHKVWREKIHNVNNQLLKCLLSDNCYNEGILFKWCRNKNNCVECSQDFNTLVYFTMRKVASVYILKFETSWNLHALRNSG